MVVLLISEMRRLLRSPGFLIFTVGFPVVYFLIFSQIYDPPPADRLQVLVLLMTNMAAFGAISASINVGARVAIERAVGWNRQLRLTPLPGWGYLAAKAAVAMLVALPALLLVFAVGAAIGVDLPPLVWPQVFFAAWIGVLPFAAIGLLLGTLATPDSAQGVSTVTMLVFSLLGGIFIPTQILPPFMVAIAQALPSYWMAEIAGRQAFGGGVPLEGVAVVVAWFVVAGGLAALRYRRDALRV